LYVVSEIEPDFSDFVRQASSVSGIDGWSCRDYGPFLSRLTEGERWAFRLTANPSFSDPSRGGKRFANVTVTQQQEWLLRRAEGYGFTVYRKDDVLDLVVRDRRTDTFRREGKLVTIAKATFDGSLQVVDAESLRNTLVNGIGHAKAYGCGLLTLAALE